MAIREAGVEAVSLTGARALHLEGTAGAPLEPLLRSSESGLALFVTLHDFSVSPAKGSGSKKMSRGNRLLEMKITARTYRYSDASEAPVKKKGKKGK